MKIKHMSDKLQVNISVEYYHNLSNIVFSRVMFLPFAPFIGLKIAETSMITELVNDNRKDIHTDILWDYYKDAFYVTIKKRLSLHTTDHELDNIVEIYSKHNWTMISKDSLKELKTALNFSIKVK